MNASLCIRRIINSTTGKCQRHRYSFISGARSPFFILTPQPLDSRLRHPSGAGSNGFVSFPRSFFLGAHLFPLLSAPSPFFPRAVASVNRRLLTYSNALTGPEICGCPLAPETILLWLIFLCTFLFTLR
jgi:hypothetical protein